MLSDVKVAKQCFEFILGKYIIIVLQHTYCETFAETARANKEEKLVRLFYHGYKPGFVYIITVVAADYCKVHHAIGDTFSVRCCIFFHNLFLILGAFFEHKQRYGLFVTSPNKHSITSRYLCTLLKNITITMELKHGYYHLIAILVVAIWGLTFISTKVLINHGLTPQEIFFYRFLIAYLGIWVISPKRLFAGNWKDELWLMAGGLFGGSLYFFTENTALGITQASNVAFIICTAPLLTTILSLLFYKSEKATKGLVYGSILALIGVGLVVFNGSFVLKLSPVGDLLTLLAALSWAFYSLVIKKMTGRYPTVFITCKIFFYGVLTILPAFLLHPLQPDLDILLKPIVLSNLLFLAVLASLICYVLWNVVLKQLGTVRASNYIYLNPLVTMVASVIILHEQITWITLLGAGCIIFGVYQAERKAR